MMLATERLDISAAISAGLNLVREHLPVFRKLVPIMFVFWLMTATVILAPFAIAGLFYLMQRAGAGQEPQVDDLLWGFYNFGRFWAVSVYLVGVFAAGALFCGVGIAPAGGLLVFFFPFLITEKIKPGQALEKCWASFRLRPVGQTLFFLIATPAFFLLGGLLIGLLAAGFGGLDFWLLSAATIIFLFALPPVIVGAVWALFDQAIGGGGI